VSNYPDNVDFSRMTWDRPDTREESEAAATLYAARVELRGICAKVGKTLANSGFSRLRLEIIAQDITEGFVEIDEYAEVLTAEDYQMAEDTLVEAATNKGENK